MNKKQRFFIFYFLSFLAAIILFNLVTVYGETQLHAAPKISGDYSFNTTLECLKDKPLSLKIEQSGLYIFAELIAAESKPLNIPLSGSMTHEKISIATQETAKLQKLLTNCPSSLTNNLNSLKLEGTLEMKNIFGNISFNDQDNDLNFTAKKEETKTQTTETH